MPFPQHRLYNEDTAKRLETFSDAIFALACTLLVVAVEVPRSFQELARLLQGFAGFAITFGALIWIWIIHNSFFRNYRLTDGWTIALNSVLLFVVLFYVYPLKFLADSFMAGFFGIQTHGGGPILTSLADLRQLFIVFGIGFGAVYLLCALLYLNAYRQRHSAGLTAALAAEAREKAGEYLIFVGVAALSIVAASIGWGLAWGVPGWLYGLLGPFCALYGMLNTRSRTVADS